MNVQVKYLDSNAHPPKISREQTDVEESSTGKSEHEWCQRVEQGEDQGVPSQIPADLAIPGSCLEGFLIEDACLGAVPDHPPEP